MISTQNQNTVGDFLEGGGKGQDYLKVLCPRFCETIDGLEGQNKVKPACHIESMNWVLYLGAGIYNLENTG